MLRGILRGLLSLIRSKSEELGTGRGPYWIEMLESRQLLTVITPPTMGTPSVSGTTYTIRLREVDAGDSSYGIEVPVFVPPTSDTWTAAYTAPTFTLTPSGPAPYG